jgi:phosphatidate cytidylyltransferase
MGIGALRVRALSALALAIPALAAVYVGAPLFDLLFGAVALIMAFEWDRLCRGPRGALAKANDPATWALAAAIFAVVLAAALQLRELAIWLSVAGFAAVFLIARGIDRRAPLLQAFGALYIGLPYVALVWLRDDASAGLATLFWLLAVVWATDTGAMFAGKTIGGPKLAPAISPNKTWAGLAGGMLAAAAVGVAFALALDAPPDVAALISAGLAVVAQAGDLGESLVKRHFSVKDSGTLIPGHGGVFDRVDGLLAVAPVWALVLLAQDWGLWR